MNDSTDLPADRVPLGPDLKLFGGKPSALLDDLPPLPSSRPTPPLPKAAEPPKPAEPPAPTVEKPTEPATDTPPPAPQPRWVKEAIGTLLKPSRRKVAVAVGMVSLAGGAVAVRLLTPSPKAAVPAAPEVAAKEPAALLDPTAQSTTTSTANPTATADPSPAPTVAQVNVPAVTVATAGNTGGLATPELPPVGQVAVPPAATPIQPPAPLPKITAEPTPALPATGLPTVTASAELSPPALPTPAAATTPPTMYDPNLGPSVRWHARGPGWYEPRNMLPPAQTARAVVPTAWPDPTGFTRHDAAVVQAQAKEPTTPAPAVPVPLPVPLPTAPTTGTSAGGVQLPTVAPLTPSKDKEPPAELPKPAALVVSPPAATTPPPAATGPAGVQLPTVAPLAPPTAGAAPEPKQPAFKDVTPPGGRAEPHRPPVAALEPPASPPAALELTKPSGTAAITPAAATASAAKATPFSYDVDLYTPKANDNYDGISKLHYGDPRYGRALEAFNAERGGRLGDGRDVEVPPVWVLRQRYARFIGASRPSQPEPTRDRGADWAPAGGREPSAPRTFTVGSRGATFRQVAETVYGDSRQWNRIWELNPKYRADDELPGGTALKLPADAPRVRPAARSE